MAPTIDSINVLVTGFGPFPKFDGNGGVFDKNASHLITKLLPSSLPPSHPANPTKRHINIINPTAAEGQYVKTEYSYIRTYVSNLHATHKNDIDLFLHIGMADGWDYVSVERRAYKQGFSSTWWGTREEKAYYMLEDVSGKTVLDAPACPWGPEVPMGLSTDLDVDTIVTAANNRLLQTPAYAQSVGPAKPSEPTKDKKYLSVKPHHEPGSYCCGFIYYESLATKYVKGTKGQVLFCHVPGETDKASLEKARESILAIVGAAVEGILLKGG